MSFSDFNYLTTAEYAALNIAVSGITNETLAAQHISAAERLIDAYVGPWQPFFPDWTGTVTSATVSGVTSSIFGEGRPPDYWAVGGLYVEFYEGTAAGQKRLVTASSGLTVTVGAAWSPTPAAGDKFALRQLSRFPRWPQDWFRTQRRARLPEGLKQAVAAQVAYMVAKGSEAFGQWSDAVIEDGKAGVTSEAYGTGYSVSRDPRAAGVGSVAGRMIAPQARLHLKGLVSTLGCSTRGVSTGRGR